MVLTSLFMHHSIAFLSCQEIVADKLRNCLVKLGKDAAARDEKLFEIFEEMDEDDR